MINNTNIKIILFVTVYKKEGSKMNPLLSIYLVTRQRNQYNVGSYNPLD